jgi:hypothetical protein
VELPVGAALEAVLPGAEVRRVWPTRAGQEYGVLKDHRTGTEHRVDGAFDYAPALAAYVRYIVFDGKVA